MSSAEIKNAVKEVLKEMGLVGERPAEAGSEARPGPKKGPRVLALYHTGLERYEEAQAQVALIEARAEKTAFFLGPEARAILCSEDVKDRTGARCSLNAAPPEGLSRVMDKVRVVLLPTLSLKVAARVAWISLDCVGSELVTMALGKGKTVLAASDGFIAPGVTPAEGLAKEVKVLLDRLESFGVILCPTAQLAEKYQELSGAGAQPEPRTDKRSEPEQEALSLVTGKHITTAATEGRTLVRAALGGIITPLARDMAKEYNVEIVVEND